MCEERKIRDSKSERLDSDGRRERERVGEKARERRRLHTTMCLRGPRAAFAIPFCLLFLVLFFLWFVSPAELRSARPGARRQGARHINRCRTIAAHRSCGRRLEAKLLGCGGSARRLSAFLPSCEKEDSNKLQASHGQITASQPQPLLRSFGCADCPPTHTVSTHTHTPLTTNGSAKGAEGREESRRRH